MSLLTLNEVHFRWSKQDEWLLKLPRFELNAGDRVFLRGPSGCGKSTLLSLIAGFLSPEQGCIKLLNAPFSAQKASQRDQLRADHMGYVFQMFNLLPYLSVIDNVRLPLQFSKRRRQRLEKPAQQAAEDLLKGLGLPLKMAHRPVHQLSIGQQQRVAVARALIGSPELIIADEPTSALDHANRDSFMKLLLEQVAQTDTGLLFVSHDPTLAKHFDHHYALPELNQAQQESTQ
ncbi:putative ABC transporter ATP-binding protein [Vibrio stylophorae]|uniref:ABC transporter ATP-binding protein n=1 Tax=Vibrio stylophorae TaxID=659351 RepID=A0ABN8DQ18_9VIBR|nr:ABC transporter ATP-binding protein [Vibrio stylophorae]CAH0532538.1 putative ABC transporter ATP-binding protein [Vibrio stylophorae]